MLVTQFDVFRKRDAFWKCSERLPIRPPFRIARECNRLVDVRQSARHSPSEKLSSSSIMPVWILSSCRSFRLAVSGLVRDPIHLQDPIPSRRSHSEECSVRVKRSREIRPFARLACSAAILDLCSLPAAIDFLPARLAVMSLVFALHGEQVASRCVIPNISSLHLNR
jgi:hypothetical protein